MPTLAVITTPRWGDLLLLGALIVGFVWMGRLGWRLLDLWLYGMQTLNDTRPHEYADFDADPADDDMTAVMDGLREYPDLDEDQVTEEDTGRHAAIPPTTSVETTGFMPRVNVLPVDDAAALRIAESLSGDGAR